MISTNKEVPEKDNTSLWLKRLSRASAWILLAGIVVLAVSGWGITQTGIIYSLTGGLVDRRLANSIHRAANLPLAVFFISHVLINLWLAVPRLRHSRVPLFGGIFIAVGLVLLAVVAYLEYFRPGG